MKKITKAFLSPILTYFLFLILYFFLYIYLFKIRNKTKVVGKENLPRRSFGTFLLSKHDTFIDSVVNRPSIIKLQDIFFRQNLIPYDLPDFNNFYSNKIGAFFMKHLRNIPIKRNTKDLSTRNEVVGKICQTLEKYNVLSYFEGGRGIDGIRPCVTSVAEVILKLLQQDYDLIVLPMYIDGMKKVMPREIGQKYWKISFGHKVTIIVGKRIDFSDIIKMDCQKEKKIYLIKKRVRESVIALKPQ